MNHPLRPLSHIEQAFTLSNEASPLCVICVLHLAPGPEEAALRQALARLPARHVLLRAGIAEIRGALSFHELVPAPPIGLTVVPRADAGAWRGVAEAALNTTFDRSGPLMRCWYLPGAGGGEAELIVGFHHAIIDGAAARLLLHELLSLAGGVALPVPPPVAAPSSFPAAFRGLKLAGRLLSLAGRQLREEWRFRREGVAAPIPAGSRNAILSFRLSPERSQKLSLLAGRQGLSLNAVLLAAMAGVVLRRRHAGGKARLVRLISFADLRAALSPPVSDQELGCYISMLRLCVPVGADTSVDTLAAAIRNALFRAGRRGEVFLMSWLSKYLIRMVLRLRNQRLGLAALSFIGTLDLRPAYGPIRLLDVQAYITNNRFGPELSAFGKLLFGSLGLDFTYLTSEIDAAQARAMVEEIEEVLTKLSDSPYL